MMTPSCERLKRRKRRKHGKISECSSFTTGKSRGSSWKMTRKEKVGQLNQRLYGFRIYERDGEKITFTDEFYEEVEKMGGLGVLYGFYRADPWADKDEKTGIIPALAKKAYNSLQKYVLEHSRLHIPVMMSSECPHGHQALGGGLLPVNLTAGATFDPEALKRGYEACSGKRTGGGKTSG